MKRFVRTLSLMICMALLMTAAPVDVLVSAYASEVLEDVPTLETDVAEVMQPSAQGDGKETEGTDEAPASSSDPAEPDDGKADKKTADTPQQSGGAASETGSQPMDLPTVESTAEPERKDENSIDYTADAGKSPAFALGYAQILTDGAPLYAHSDAAAEIKAKMGKDGVVYVLGREDEPGRLKVTFNAGAEKGLDEGWMDAAALRPIEPVEEAAAYARFCADEENVLYYNTLPLNVIVCSYVVAGEMTQAPEEGTSEAQDKTDDGILSLEQLQIAVTTVYEEDAGSEEDEDTAAPMLMSAVPMSAAPAAIDASGIACAAENLYLHVNDTYDLATSEFIRLAPEGATATLSYATEDAEIAAIDDKGLISAKKIGKATITVSVSEAIKASFTVNVCEAANAVTLAPEKLTMAVGASADLSVSFPENTYSAYTFESSDPATLTVDADGKLHALKAGSATVALKTDNGLSTSCAVTVLPPAESASFSETSVQLVAGTTRDMSALLRLSPEGALNDLTYSTDKSEIIEVNPATGEIKALAAGTANVIVTSAANAAVTATCEVTVLAQAESIRFDPAVLNIGVGNIIDLNTLLKAEPEGSYTGCTFQTSNKKYVAASADGLIKGVKVGSATITAVSHNGKTASIKVQVYNAPRSITLSPASYTLGVEQEGSLKVSFPSKTYSLYSLSSDKPEVVSVDAEGRLVAHAAGTATITATSLNGKKDSTLVTVLAAPDTISATHAQYTMGVGMSSTAVQGVYPANTMCGFEYASSDAGVVEVNAATGELTAKGEGVATITITSKNSKRATASCVVTVLPAPESVSFREATLKIGVGNIVDMNTLMQVSPENSCANYTFKTSNKKYVAASTEGLIKGVKAGSATITAVSHNGKTASIKVQVYNAPRSITLSPASYTLGVEQEGSLKVSFPSKTYSLYSLSSDKPEVVSVDAEGRLVAHAAGTATITATSLNGKKDSTVVTVLAAPDTISATHTQYTMGVGMSSTAVQGVYPANTMCAFEYASSDAGVVEVNAATGELTAKGEGVATITITSKNSKRATASCAVTVLPAPESVSFREATLKIGVGNIVDMNTLMQVSPENSCANYTFKTSNKKYVAASTEGLIKGVKAGSATITATSHNGKTASIKVQVYNAPRSITLSPASYTLGVEQEGSLKVSFPSKTYSLYSLSSDKPEVVSVDAEGRLVAHAAGTATITATSLNGKKDSTVVTVLAAPDTISATHTQYTMGVGMSSTAVQGVYPANTMCGFEYASSDAGVVEVNAATGELTAKGEGVATITITSKNSKRATASCVVTVLPAPASVSFREATLKIGKGNIVDMNTLMQVSPENTCANYTFKTSNKKYVAVDANGLIKGLRAGTVTITATAHNGKTASIKVQVYNAPTKVTLTPAAQSLGVGMTSDLKVTFPSKTYSLYSFTSSDESVATVNEAGRVTALKPGTATITVTTANGRSAKCTVTVKEAPTFVEFLFDEYELSEGMKLTLDPIIDANALAAFTFTSSNPGVASVDGNGVVTGHVAGSATITVKTHNGITNQYPCTVKVSPAPKTLDYNGMPTVVIAKGDKVVIPEPIALDASGNECPASYTFKSSNSKYAKVSGNTVTGVKTGTVTITAISHNGKTASFKLKVVSEKITGLQLAYTDMVLYCNDDYMETRFLYAEPTGSSINYGSLSYVSSNPKVAFVTEEGLVAGLNPGNTVITVTAYNGVSATCKVEVRKLTTTLYFETPEATVTLGDQYITDPIVDFDSYGALSFASSDPSVAVVDENGHVTTLKSGDVTITATTPNHLSAETKLHIIPCPTGIRLNVAGMNLHVGDSFTLKAELEADAEEFNRSIYYIPEDPTVAQVDAYGKVTALKPGSTRICVSTYNHIEAYCKINVLEEGNTTHAEFAWESATMVLGDTADLEFNLNKEAFERGFTLTSANPDVLSVDSANWTVTAKAAAPEGVKLMMTINAGEGEVETLAEEISCTIYIIEKSAAAFSANELSLKTYNESNPQASRGELKLTGLPENLIGTYKLYVEDGALVTYDEKTGAVQALDVAGETNIVCKTYDRTISCKVTVDYLSTYRAVIIGEYINSSETGSNLPFGGNNLSAVKTTLQNSYVDGQTYDQITYLPGNPTQAQIQSAISSTFADAKEGDVSVVYIISHGYYGRADINNGGYFFGTPHWSVTKPDTIVTSNELMSWLAPIEGNVVLLLDSCRSGGFIRDQRSALEAEGNIAVLTAQTYDKTASYFIRASDKYSLEFLTYAFCYGLGYQYDQNIFLSSMAADSNGDNRVTVGEAFAYAKAETTSLVKAKALAYFKAGSKTGFLVPGVKTNAQLYAWGGQYPQSYIPAALNDVVIYAR